LRDDKELIISFRGTDSVQDAIANVNLLPVNFYCGGRVHMGYMNYYERLRLDVLSYILYHITINDITGISFVGHSLGASVLLCALEVAYMINIHNIKLKCYTFGAPAIGNAEFNDKFSKRIKDVWRVVYDSDIVPKLPNTYDHLGLPIVLKHNDLLPPHKSRNNAYHKLKCIEHHNMDYYLKGIRRASTMSLNHKTLF
jgi:predicted lipase